MIRNKAQKRSIIKKLLSEPYNPKKQFLQLLYIYRKYRLKNSFQKWKYITKYYSFQEYQRIFHEYPLQLSKKSVFIPKYEVVIPHKRWIMDGTKIISSVLLSWQSRQLRYNFLLWKSNIQYILDIYQKYFSLWNLYICKLKLQRMNIHSFCKIIKPITKKLYQGWLSLGWIQLQSHVDWYKSTIRIRLLFRIWRSYTKQAREERRVLFQPIIEWRDVVQNESSKRRLLCDYIEIKVNHRLIKYVWSQWKHIKNRCHQLSKLHDNPKIWLRRAFSTWCNDHIQGHRNRDNNIPITSLDSLVADINYHPKAYSDSNRLLKPSTDFLSIPSNSTKLSISRLPLKSSSSLSKLSSKSRSRSRSRSIPTLPNYNQTEHTSIMDKTKVVSKISPSNASDSKIGLRRDLNSNIIQSHPRHHRDCRCYTCRQVKGKIG